MALNFPSNPQLNDTYTQGTTTWVWNGVAWNLATTSPIQPVQTNGFSRIGVPGQPNIIANTAEDTLNFTSGNNVLITTNSETNTITVATNVEIDNLFSVSTVDGVRSISLNDSLEVQGGAGITTTIDENNRLIISNTFAETTSFSALTEVSVAGLTFDKVFEPAIVMLRVDNSGTSAYTFPSHYSGNNPTIFALAGATIAFDLTNIPGHPFEIQNSAGQPFNTGLVHVAPNGTVSTGAAAQGKTSGTLYWRINESLSGNFRYQCTAHAPMVGAITVKRLSII